MPHARNSTRKVNHNKGPRRVRTLNAVNHNKAGRSWERRPGESPEAWLSFVQWREMAPIDRTVTKLATLRECSPKLVDTWRRRHNWHARTLALEAHREELKGIRTSDRRLEAAQRHADTAARLVNKVGQRISELSSEEIEAGMIAPMLRAATEIERAALGDSAKDQAGLAGSMVIDNGAGQRVGISWGANVPTWLAAPATEQREGEGANAGKGVLLPSGVKVLGPPPRAQAPLALPKEPIIDVPISNVNQAGDAVVVSVSPSYKKERTARGSLLDRVRADSAVNQAEKARPTGKNNALRTVAATKEKGRG